MRTGKVKDAAPSLESPVQNCRLVEMEAEAKQKTERGEGGEEERRRLEKEKYHKHCLG